MSSSTSQTVDQIRGSSVIFAGRMFALGLQTATQILIVRMLTKGDFGSFAYGLAIVASARAIISFGHSHSLTRFLSLYDERGERAKVAGTIVMEVLTVVTAGAFLFLSLLAFDDVLTGSVVDDPRAIDLLLILILLAPLEALERIFEAIFAIFTRPRAIVFRKYVLVPLLRLGLVLALWLTTPSVTVLAGGYVAISAVGLAAYTMIVVRLFRERDLLGFFRPRKLEMPVREVWAFSSPLMSNELVMISITTVSLATLGYVHGAVAVADLRSIFPAARLNQIVYFAFSLLFLPLATRFFARGDNEGMKTAYWQTAAWVAVLSFPAFALTAPLAEPTTVFLFGERYRDSATFLALLSFAYYFGTAVGFNALALRAYGRIRYTVGVNFAVAFVNAALTLALVRPYAALGVAIANAVSLVLHNVLNQLGLRRLGIPLFDARYARLYTSLVVASGSLAAIQWLAEPPLAVGLALAAVASLAVMAVGRETLEIESTYPELMRIPGLRRVFAKPS